ncbi:4-phosphoerythronate dehydrogenase [Gilvimarinus polysaccharolyticus]|uniref:4-phosphoerythronate dehydrogenase n=1 Tax=Gilvimarinus polysaccharolyticus TaxID=863921 RepID=UPI0006737EA0|nr:4-phosphoerythronate dehydrogenase [Gilvimarinus polysaccharolyticus]
MKIVIDENIPLAEDFFSAHGEIVRLPGRQLSAADVADADALLVRSVTRVDEALLGGSQVKFVGTCTIGMDHLDQPWLDQQGIRYINAPGCNANSVVEYVYAALAHLNIDWRGKTVGIIGCGNVGGALYRALTAQGVNCRCYDPLLSLEQNPDLCELEDVLQCDIVSLHTPLTTTGMHPSRHLLTEQQLLQLPRGGILLNCGRGAVIDNKALLQVMHERSDLQVVLDVWEWEPNIDLSLLARVALGSPHIAGYSFDGKLKGTAMIYDAFCESFGLAPSVTLTDVLPAVEHNRIEAPLGADDWQAVRELIDQVYAIAADDKRLRTVASDAGGQGEALSQGFDQLRKDYPVRREFNNYQVTGVAANTPLAITLKAMGFIVQ